jgi:penicillin-binding protein 1C
LKPVLSQIALEKHIIRPNDILADVPTRYAIPGAKLYSPVDYSETFQGPVRVRFALANSLNIPAVRVLEKVGVNHFLEHLHQLGFTHLSQSPDHYGLGLALGSGEVSLWELAKAYLILARQGIHTGIHYQVEMNRQPPNRQPELSPSSAAKSAASLITDMLSDSHARARAFGVESLLSLPFPTAVKTGTSSDFRDTWTVGFTSDYTVATWVGNFDGAPMQQVSGVTGAAPLWNRIMLHLHEQREPQPFSSPVGMVQRPICALSGARPTPACPSVVQEYFFPKDLSDYDRQPDPFYQVTHNGNGQPQYRLNLPQEYNEWLAMQPAVPRGDGLRILSPRNGDLFILEKQNANSENAGQRLEFRLATLPSQPVEWRLNGKVIHSATQSNTKSEQTTHSVFWVPTPGNWTLQVTSGQETDQVKFQVQMAENRPTRRGFSFMEGR